MRNKRSHYCIKPVTNFLIDMKNSTAVVDNEEIRLTEDTHIIWADTVRKKRIILESITTKSIVGAMDQRGDYCIAGIGKEGVFCLTDMFGSRPVFLSESRMTLSNRIKFLSSGRGKIADTNPVPGSTYIAFHKDGLRRASIEHQEENNLSLESLLELAVKERLLGIRKVAIAFSGGLDSSLIAYIAKKKCNAVLYNLKVGEGIDSTAERASQLLDMELRYVHVDETVLRSAFNGSSSSSLWKSAMDYAIALGFQIIAGKAKEDGYNILLTGQGADELFGGYNKYLKFEKDASALREALKKDVKCLYIGAARDAEAIRDGGCIPSFPFLDEKVGRFAEKLNLSMKVKNGVRKIALRKCAENLGLPEEIFNAPKKAFQYSSGLQKLVCKVFF